MKDAAEIKPKFVPTDALLPRDNSGGPDFKPKTAEFGNHEKTGTKDYLTP